MLAARPEAPEAQGAETFETIAKWCEDTFGPIEPARIVSRAAEEMEELKAEPTRVEEAADVVIVLSRYPGLWETVERKMAVNRKRRWRLMGDGTGYHIKDEPAPPSSSGQGGR
ncbi:nucleotide pyrophosphohydrolase [Methylorubrum zatmanii]|nr:nucleotide pyrophosphohydrolase [Methylorubrum zatmanii]